MHAPISTLNYVAAVEPTLGPRVRVRELEAYLSIAIDVAFAVRDTPEALVTPARSPRILNDPAGRVGGIIVADDKHYVGSSISVVWVVCPSVHTCTQNKEIHVHVEGAHYWAHIVHQDFCWLKSPSTL